MRKTAAEWARNIECEHMLEDGACRTSAEDVIRIAMTQARAEALEEATSFLRGGFLESYLAECVAASGTFGGVEYSKSK